MTITEAPRLLIVEDEPDSAEWVRLLLESKGYDVKVALDGQSAEKTRTHWQADVILMDLSLPDANGLDLLKSFKQTNPDCQVVVVTGYGSIPKAVEAMREGAMSFVEKPLDVDMLLAILDKAQERVALSIENRRLRDDLENARTFAKVVARSDRMKQLCQMVRRVAPSDASVLIHGENGTGKELIATAVHEYSKRASGPFIKINCAAIPSDLIESELFGHKKGAFTGAISDKVGLVEMAAGGSLLLDEIGEMPAALQVKLLRVLQEREFRPVGGSRQIAADFRLICSTNINPDAAIDEGRLRKDLYFRINTFTLAIPSLRERPEDIPLLADHFLQQYATRYGRPVQSISKKAGAVLTGYQWPGNVRELEHVIERAVIMAQETEIGVEDLPAPMSARADLASTFVIPPHQTLAELEKAAILQTLERTQGNKRATASILGVYRPTLYSKLKKYRIEDQTSAYRTRQASPTTRVANRSEKKSSAKRSS